MVVRDACPACGVQHFKKNAHIHNGKQNHQCKACGRQFVLDAANRVIAEEQRTLVERLLCEKISLHGICRVVGVSIGWLMDFIVDRFAALPDHLHVRPVASPRDVLIGRLEVEADEMWSFVKQKANKQWVWIAMDKQTRQIIAFHVGDRSHDSAKQLWANLPTVYRERATFYTDQYAVYKGVIGRSYEFGDRAKPNKASKRPLTQASLRCKRWLKPSSLQRIPTPLNRC